MNGTDNKGFELSEKPTNGINDPPPDYVEQKPEQVQQMSKARIFKNLFVVCFGFLCLFSTFQALGNLQSTLHVQPGLGTAAQSTIYAALIVSSFFLPTLLIRKLGAKLTLGLCMLTYTPYVAAQFAPSWGTMIPAAIILGFGASPMWSAKCTYLNEIGYRYSKYVETSMDIIIVRFFGIFFMFFQSSQIWGNLISYLILVPSNKTVFINPDVVCGINFDLHAKHNNSNLERPDDDQVNTLIGVYLGIGLLGGILVLIFLDPLEREFSSAASQLVTGKQLLVATFNHLKRREQIILIPITIYSGLEQSFFLSEFTRSYVGCAWGIYNIGLVAICFGVVNAFVSLTSGPQVKLVGRLPIFVIAALINVGACIGLILWTPVHTESVVFFIIAGLWGAGDGVWQTQINAFYGVIFKGDEEPAFANYRLWESLGFVLAFAYSEYIGVPAKMAILLAFLALGMAGYVYTEVVLVRRKTKAMEVTSDTK